MYFSVRALCSHWRDLLTSWLFLAFPSPLSCRSSCRHIAGYAGFKKQKFKSPDSSLYLVTLCWFVTFKLSFHFFLAIFSHRHLFLFFFFTCMVDELLLSEVVRTRIGHLLKSSRIKFFLLEREEWFIVSFHDHRPNSGVL